MNTTLIILAILLALVGIAGSIIPGIAGPPFSWLALLLLNFTTAADYTPLFLIATAAVAAVITVLDYIVPSLSTKRHGGSKAGVWGCNIGLIVSIIGLPFGPTGSTVLSSGPSSVPLRASSSAASKAATPSVQHGEPSSASSPAPASNSPTPSLPPSSSPATSSTNSIG